MSPAQAFVTSYAPRLRQYANSFVAPVIQTQTVAPTSRTTKRGTTVINYADDAYDNDDFDDSEDTRRPTGLRSLRREDLEKRDTAIDKLGKEIYEPVDVQGIYREWMIRRTVKPTYYNPEPYAATTICMLTHTFAQYRSAGTHSSSAPADAHTHSNRRRCTGA